MPIVMMSCVEVSIARSPSVTGIRVEPIADCIKAPAEGVEVDPPRHLFTRVRDRRGMSYETREPAALDLREMGRLRGRRHRSAGGARVGGGRRLGGRIVRRRA